MPGLSAKVFRTYNASYTMSTLLKELKDVNISLQEKIKLYNDCNRKVAILCNHKRTVGAGHEAQMEKMGDKVCQYSVQLRTCTDYPKDQSFEISEVAPEAYDP